MTKYLAYDGHYRPQAPTNHFLGLCVECDAHYLSTRSLAQVEGWYRQGMISQAEYEGYMWAWVVSAPRSGTYTGWYAPPEDPVARTFGEKLIELATERKARA